MVDRCVNGVNIMDTSPTRKRQEKGGRFISRIGGKEVSDEVSLTMEVMFEQNILFNPI